MNDIIASIATAQGIGGISIIRISGNDVVNEINDLFKISLLDQKSNEIKYNHFLIDSKYFDEVLVSRFDAPNTFTGEDVIEINCHGGIYVTNEILKYILLKKDVRLAQNGEFSKRAFLNGKKTLDEMIAVNDIIFSENKAMHEMALNSLSGQTKKLINELRESLLNVITQIEVNIDYPEYEDIFEFTNKYIKSYVKDYLNKSKEILVDSNRGQLLKTGIDTVIIGSPNVGKSTLLNILSREDKAIVTDIEGTTRDIVENSITIGNVKLNLFDTAGIRKTTDQVESIGISKSIEMINKAKLILFVVDGSRNLTTDEHDIYENKIKLKNHIVLINKTDLVQNIDKSIFNEYLEISALKDENIYELENKILHNLDLQNFDTRNSSILSNISDISKLEKAVNILSDVLINIEEEQVIDLIEMDLKDVLFIYDEILNINSKDNLIDELFSRFCLGK